MKKALYAGIALAFLLGLLVPTSVALAHHPAGSASATCDDGYSVSGDYVGGSSTRWLETNVTLTVDGVPENMVINQGPVVSPGFNIFTRNGVALTSVDVVGTIKMFNNVHTNAVPADTDTDTFDEDHSSNSGFNAGVNFFDSDKQVTITADPGYSITSVGIDYTGSDANEVTLGAQSSPFTYDAPGSETIDNITITIFRPATLASDAKGALLDTFTFNFHEVLNCATATPTATDTALPTETATPTATNTPDPCVESPDSCITPDPSPTATIDPCADQQCVTPDPSPTEGCQENCDPTATPKPRPPEQPPTGPESLPTAVLIAGVLLGLAGVTAAVVRRRREG